MNLIECLVDKSNFSIRLREELLQLVESYVQEVWSGVSSSKHNYENPETQKEYGYTSKRVEMSPDDYIKKCARQLRRKGFPQKTRTLEKEIVQGREDDKNDEGNNAIDSYAKQIKDKDVKVNEPYLFYHHKGDITRDVQDGLHRAIAAKKAGEGKIPVHIFHPNQKKNKVQQREGAEYKALRKKDIGEQRSENKRIADKGGKRFYQVPYRMP